MSLIICNLHNIPTFSSVINYATLLTDRVYRFINIVNLTDKPYYITAAANQMRPGMCPILWKFVFGILIYTELLLLDLVFPG